MPFSAASVSHLVLFDVFHHLEAPNTFLKEARRVMSPQGRVILFEPFISAFSFPIYGLLHHEPVAWRNPINLSSSLPRPHGYYAAEGNATRLFFRREVPGWPEGWTIFHAEAFSSFHYLLSVATAGRRFIQHRPSMGCDEWTRTFALAAPVRRALFFIDEIPA